MSNLYTENGGFIPDFTIHTTSIVLTSWSRSIIIIDATNNNITITLPIMTAQVNDGKILIKRIDSSSNTVNIIPNGSQILNGIAGGSQNLLPLQNILVINSRAAAITYAWLGISSTGITIPGTPSIATDATNKAYVDAAISGAGTTEWRGTFAGDGGLYPSSGGSGTAGAIKAGDYWDVPVTYSYPSVAPNTTIYAPNSVRALTDNPGQNPENWFIAENSLLREAGDYDNFPIKTTPIGADTLLIEDSANSENKAEITLASLPVSTATQTAINNAVTAGQNWQGTWNGSGSLYPTTRPGGAAIQAGDVFSVNSTYTYPAVSGTTIYQATTLRALVSNPGQTAANWTNEGNAVDKQVKVPTAVLNDIATWDNAGNTKDSGTSISTSSTANDNITLMTSAATQSAILANNPTTNTKAICVSSNGNDTTGNGTFLKPYLTLQKAEAVVSANGFVYILDAGTYTGNITALVSNVTYTCLGSLNNNKIAYMTYTGTFTIPSSIVGRAFQGITFAPGANQAIVHNSNNGTLNIDRCTFNGTNTNIITMAANINNNAINWITNSDFTNATGNVNLADNTNNIAFTATVTAGNNTLTATSIDTAGLPVGYTLTAPGLQPGTKVVQRISATVVQINYPALVSSGSSITIYHPVSHFMNNNAALKLNIGLGQVVFGYNNFIITVSGNAGNYIDTSKTPIIPFANLTAMYAQNALTFGGVGSIAEVTNDPTATNNGLWQCVALPYSTATNWIQISQAAATVSLPSASPTNLYADKTIGNDTTGNGSEAYPYASLTQAISSATTSPSVINLTSNTIFTDVVTWTSSKTNITVQGNNFSETGGTQTLSGQQTFGSGSRYNNYINTYHSTGSTAPFAHVSGALCSRVFKNITINTTAADWLGLNAGVSNYDRLNNIAFQTNGINAINLPAFTNPYTLYIDQQDLFKGALLFTGTGAATTVVVIDSKVADGQVRLPSTYVGNIIWGSKSFGGTLGSSAHPIGIVTTQSDLTAILNWTTDTTYDGYYAITGFTPTTFSAGTIFGKQTAAGIATNLWWARTPAYNPAAVRDSTTTYQFKQSTNTWSVVGSGSVPVLNTTLTTNMTNSDVSMSVTSTNGFSPTGILYIDNEAIAYTGITATTFTGLARGLYNTTAASHTSGAIVTSLGLPYNSGNPTGGNIIGAIMPFGGTTAPTGAFICDGSTISRTTYSALFAVIGTAHGSGDGSTTFNIPDLRGRVVRGVDGTAGRDPDSATRTAMNTGGNTGNQIGSVQLDAFASHTHTYNQGSALVTQAQGGTGSASNYNYTNTNTNTGATGGNETRMKNAYENWIIWYNNFGNYGDVYLANNNAMTGNNTFAGTSTFNNSVIIPNTQATGTFTPIVRQTSDGSLKLQPPASSISYNAIAYQSTPPTSPNVNDTYIVQPTGTGAWAGQNNAIATWNGSAWGFYTPNNNDIASLINGTVYQYSSSTSSWSIYTLSGGAYTLLNVNTSLTLPGWQIMALVNATNNVVITLPAVSNSNTTQQIIVKRIDNNTNYTVSIVPSGSQTIELTSAVYLYAQNDSIEITSNGANNAFISADNRNSGGTGTKSYLQAYVYNQTTALTTGNPILYNNNISTAPIQIYGTNISMPSSGTFLIQPGSTYRLKATAGLVQFASSSAFMNFQWYNVTTSSFVGSAGIANASSTVYNDGANEITECIITPSVATTLQVIIYNGGGSAPTYVGDNGLGNAGNRFGVAYIEQISTPTNVVNTTSYLSAFATTTQTLNTVGQTLSFGNTLSGSNITFDGTTATLIGGKTYWLEFNPLVVSSGANLSVQWYNVTTGSYFGQTILIYQSNVYANPLRFPITFSQNTQIQLKVVGPITSSGSLGDGSRGIYPVINIHQIGTTPVVISGTTTPQFAKNVTGTSCRGIVFIAKNQLWQMGYYTGSGSSTNATANCTIPTIVPINNPGAAIAGWSDVAYSYDSAIALTNDGRVFFWGYNTIAGAFQPIATLVPGLTGITISKIYCSTNRGNATSNSFFCISSTGTVYSFGDNSWGQLGIGNTTSTNTATLISTVISGKIITKISVSGNGAIHVAAIDSTGQLYTWGYGAQGTTPTCNPLGSGVANTNSSVPIAISGFTNVTDVWAASEYTSSSGANNFTRVLRSDGSSWASGNNSTGQLATGNTTSSSSFVRESLNKTNISAIYAYETYNGGCSIIIDTSGILYFSGNNNDQCFGDGSANNSAHTSFTNTTQLTNAGFQGKMLIGTAGIQPKVLMMGTANGGYNTCIVLDNTGTVWAAGRYQEGQTSNPNSSTTTAFLSAIAGTKGVPIIDIKASGLNGVDGGLIMLFQDGTIMSAGINTSGALGNETVPSNVMVAYGRHVIGYAG